jgi:chromosome partitioning protein
VGKSTIAVNLAVAAALEGKRVMIVDADVQGSSMGFRGSRESDDIKATAITTPTLHKDLSAFQGFDLIFIDAGGRDSTVFRSAVMACDLIIIPVLPSVYDVWAAGDTINMVREASIYKPQIKSRLLLNQLMPNTIMARETLEELGKFKEEISLLDSRLHSRSAYKNSVMQGLGVMESEPKGKAASEVKALYAEVINLV